jgi:hypothetical protein
MSDSTDEPGRSHLMRWLVLVAIALALMVGGRKWALSRADREFDERLREVDDRRE